MLVLLLTDINSDSRFAFCSLLLLLAMLVLLPCFSKLVLMADEANPIPLN